MQHEKSKSQIFSGKLLNIVDKSIELYYKDEQKKLAHRRWTVAKTKLKSISSLKYKNLRKIKTTNDIETINNKK